MRLAAKRASKLLIDAEADPASESDISVYKDTKSSLAQNYICAPAYEGYVYSGVSEAIQQLQSTWEFVAVCQFFHLYYNDFGMDDFYTEQLEDNLPQIPATKYIIDIHILLLQRSTCVRNIDHSNWLGVFSTQLKKRMEDEDNMIAGFIDGIEYDNIPLCTKVLILQRLCDWQFVDLDRFKPLKNTEENDQLLWRVEPIGFDAQNNTYFLFDDNRVYMDTSKRNGLLAHSRRKMTIESDSDDDLSGTPSKKWTMVCRTIKDWETWPERFQASTHPDERALYKYLTLEAKPHAISQIKKWNTVRNLSEALQNRKRSTRLQIRELTDSESMYNGVSSRSRRQTRATENTGNSSLNLVKRLEEESRRKEAQHKAKELKRLELEKKRESRILERARRNIKYESLPLYVLPKVEQQSVDDFQHSTSFGGANDSHPISPTRLMSALDGSIPSTSTAFVKNKRKTYAEMSKSDVVESSLTRQRSKPVKSSYSSTPKRTRTVATTSAFTDDLVVNTPTTESIKQNTKMAVSFLNDEPVEMPEANNETWFFHCRCGLSGINLDDGFPMIECGSCKKWSHIACAITTKSGKPCTSAQVQKWEANDYTCPKCTIKARRKSAAAIKTFKSSPSTLSAAAFPGDAQYLASDDDVSDRSQLGLPLSMKTKKRRVVSDMNAKPTQKQPVSQTFTYSPSANEPVWNNNVVYYESNQPVIHTDSNGHDWGFARGLDAIVEAALYSDTSTTSSTVASNVFNTYNGNADGNAWIAHRGTNHPVTLQPQSVESNASQDMNADLVRPTQPHSRIPSAELSSVTGLLSLVAERHNGTNHPVTEPTRQLLQRLTASENSY